jgi:cbb3-type cytochrome oxidase maturation protein
VNVLVLQVFVSLMLVAISVAFFIWSVSRRESDHADRLSLAPLEDDERNDP